MWPLPNLTLLNNALRQTSWPGPSLTDRTWKEAVMERLRGTDWPRAGADVQTFLENPAEVDLLRDEILADALIRRM